MEEMPGLAHHRPGLLTEMLCDGRAPFNHTHTHSHAYMDMHTTLLLLLQGSLPQ